MYKKGLKEMFELLLLVLLATALIAIFVPQKKEEIFEEDSREICFPVTEEPTQTPETQESKPMFFRMNENVPLTKEQQMFVTNALADTDFPPELIYAIMYVESGFNTEAISSEGSYGIMQLHKPYIKHHMDKTKTQRERYGITSENPLNFEVNVLMGINALNEWQHLYNKETFEEILAHYNGGFRYPNYKYANKVIEIMKGYYE